MYISFKNVVLYESMPKMAMNKIFYQKGRKKINNFVLLTFDAYQLSNICHDAGTVPVLDNNLEAFSKHEYFLLVTHTHQHGNACTAYIKYNLWVITSSVVPYWYDQLKLTLITIVPVLPCISINSSCNSMLSFCNKINSMLSFCNRINSLYNRTNFNKNTVIIISDSNINNLPVYL